MKKLFILLFAFVFCGFSYSQTLVYPGDNTLSAAIAAANDGDVLQLATAATATEYNETQLFNLGTLHKRITIIGRTSDSDARPIVRIRTAPDGSSTPNFFFLGDSAALIVKGVEFDGTDASSAASVSHLTAFVLPDPVGPITIHKIEFDDCLIHDLTGNVLHDGQSSGGAGYIVCDTTIINNTIMHDTKTTVYYKYSGSNYISVTNSTFYNIGSYGMRIAGPGYTNLPNNTPTALVDHTTWYNTGIGDEREMILLEKGPNLNPWTITNSIFDKQATGTHTIINIKELADTADQHDSSLCLWQYNKVAWNQGIVVDTVTMDPQFANPDNGDFTLPANSPLLTFATDGGSIGDPRWAVNATAVEGKGTNAPLTFSLQQNYPNPFNPSTKITFTLDKAQMADLIIYNLLGQEVTRLVHGNLSAGAHTINFDASNLPSGVYIYRLSTQSRQISKKMVLLK